MSLAARVRQGGAALLQAARFTGRLACKRSQDMRHVVRLIQHTCIPGRGQGTKVQIRFPYEGCTAADPIWVLAGRADPGPRRLRRPGLDRARDARRPGRLWSGCPQADPRSTRGTQACVLCGPSLPQDGHLIVLIVGSSRPDAPNLPVPQSFAPQWDASPRHMTRAGQRGAPPQASSCNGAVLMQRPGSVAAASGLPNGTTAPSA